jgi:hypothetical protein
MTAAPAPRTALTLVTGGSAAQREATIAACLAAGVPGAAILVSVPVPVPVAVAARAAIPGPGSDPDPGRAGAAAFTPAAPVAAPAAVRTATGPAPSGLVAVLLEGLPSGQTLLSPCDALHVHRIAPGCLCCTGNLVLRVTLNRILRLRPDRLFIGLAATDHLDQLRSWLQDSPYDQLLELTADLRT